MSNGRCRSDVDVDDVESDAEDVGEVCLGPGGETVMVDFSNITAGDDDELWPFDDGDDDDDGLSAIWDEIAMVEMG